MFFLGYQLAFNTFGNLPRAKIRELRNTHKYELILDMYVLIAHCQLYYNRYINSSKERA